MTRTEAIRSLILPGLLSLLVLAVLIMLGTWQMQRLAWKENLIAIASNRVSEAPRTLPAMTSEQRISYAEEEYRPYVAFGRFLHEHEIQVFTVLSEPKGSFSGAGYWVLTPLALDNESIVIINRGFVPQEFKNPSTRKESQVQGIVRVTGLFRAPEQVNQFTPANDPAKNAWYRRDPLDIARALRLGDVLPFTLDATAEYSPGMLPQPNETKLSFTNNHLGYALTWYGLACTLIGVFGAFAWQRVRGAG